MSYKITVEHITPKPDPGTYPRAETVFEQLFGENEIDVKALARFLNEKKA